ncbi:MAG: alpha/beta hydrolase [Anaerolineae bacterium]
MQPEKARLWQGPPPFGLMAEALEPWMDLYLLPGQQSRGAVLVCPGGGYAGRAPHEQGPIAEQYNAAGFHAAVLQYRVAPHRHPAPILDAARALRLMRRESERWRIDAERIAVCGFSAGGHLAASLGVHSDKAFVNTGETLDQVSARPDALVLAYPVISTEAYGHRGSFENLLGPDPEPALLTLMSLEKQVTSRTPPTFLWHTADDGSVDVKNSLHFAEMLSNMEVPFELHVYPHGVHGLGLAPEDPHVATWMRLSIEWLQNMGW